MQDGPINKIQQLMRYVTIKKKKRKKKDFPIYKTDISHESAKFTTYKASEDGEKCICNF